jgi:hypothetical protein
VSARTRVSGPDASDPLRRADGDEHHSRRNQDEGGWPNSQTDTDRESATDKPTPGNVHALTIRVFGHARLRERVSDGHRSPPSVLGGTALRRRQRLTSGQRASKVCRSGPIEITSQTSETRCNAIAMLARTRPPSCPFEDLI